MLRSPSCEDCCHQCHSETSIVNEKYMLRGTFLCCILHYGPMLSAVFGVRSPGAWLARGQKLGLCLCPIVFLHGEATIFNIYSTTMTFA